MGAEPVQKTDVVAHQVQDLGGIAAMSPVALHIHHLPQFVSHTPSKPLIDEPAFHSEQQTPEEP
jgi:hypothetical protein